MRETFDERLFPAVQKSDTAVSQLISEYGVPVVRLIRFVRVIVWPMIATQEIDLLKPEKCEEMEKTDTPVSAPDKLARVETLATTGLAILQRIRPAFERFYATLSAKQKKALDGLIAHRGRRS